MEKPDAIKPTALEANRSLAVAVRELQFNLRCARTTIGVLDAAVARLEAEKDAAREDVKKLALELVAAKSRLAALTGEAKGETDEAHPAE